MDLDGIASDGPAHGAELERILALPRRAPPVSEAAGPWLASLTEHMTRYLRKPEAPCRCAELGVRCILKLFPVQAAALYEAPRAGGELGLIGVGHGKTALGILLPMVFPHCKRAVLFIPPNLRTQFFERDFPAWSQHFRTPTLAGSPPPWDPNAPVLHVLAYSALSTARFTQYLEEINPDLIIADEAHNLRNRQSARGGRVIRYLEAHPEVRFCCHSGTLTSKSVKDFAHLSTHALKANSPAPNNPDTVDLWAEVLDPKPVPAQPEDLVRLCVPGEHVREGFRRRLIETAGVVATEESALGTSLEFERRKVAVPDDIKGMIRTTRDLKERPDGEELPDEFAQSKCLRELACGFYYRWIYPRGEPISVIDRWFAARKAWNKEIRLMLEAGARAGLDSPLLLTKAAIRWHEGYRIGDVRIPRGTKDGPLPTWAAWTWEEWSQVHDTVHPETSTVWVNDFLAADAAEWGREASGIIWYDQTAFGARCAELGKFARYGGGNEASAAILQERGRKTIVASIKAHGTGKNLQNAFSRNLLVPMPGDAGACEQVIGRTHRTGQTADVVTVGYYSHTREVAAAVERAQRGAEYIEQTTGSRQKLCAGVWVEVAG